MPAQGGSSSSSSSSAELRVKQEPEEFEEEEFEEEGIDGPEDGDSVLVFVLPHGRDVGAFVEKEGFAVDMGSRLRSILQFLLVAIAWAVLLGTLAASVTS